MAGVNVGALSEAQLAGRLDDLAEEFSTRPITVVRDDDGPHATYRSPGEETGISLDVAATMEAALERGRQANPLAALIDHLRAFVMSTDVDPVPTVDREQADEWVETAHAELMYGGSEGDLRFSGTEVEPVYPEPGIGVGRAALRAVVATLVLQDERRVELPPVEAAPATEADDVDEVAGAARSALSAPVTLRRGDVSLTIEPDRLARLFDVEVVADPEPHLALTVPAQRVERELAEEFTAFETEPVDAGFSVSSGAVAVVPSQPGFRFAPQRAARQILSLAQRKRRRTAQLQGRTEQPELTTKEARALGVTEQVSSFTTYHSCCEPRVENIHRAADLVDGTIVEPGETFSLNDAIGPRTIEGGFVAAPAISDGEFVEEVGGGISQLATTFFNAIFFGGYDFLEYQAHSYYISRYPVGREATISTPAPDLVFLNDSDSGIFIDTYYSDTSITVSFYGTQEVEVETVTGPRRNIVQPEEECKVNKGLGRDEEVVIQEGLEGFDIVVDRIFVYPDGDEDVEQFSTHYLALPRIVERARCRDHDESSDRKKPGAGKDRR